MKTALIHDWLITEGGAEKVLSALGTLFPGPIHTLFYDEKKMGHLSFVKEKIHTSFLQKIPFSLRYYRMLLPFFPCAIEKLDLSEVDFILSSSHAVAKGISKRKDQLHICYCHTPIRYAWDLKDSYLKPLNPLKRLIATFLLERIRKWDLKSSSRVDAFIANSHYVADRIKRNYQRDSVVIYPPVEIEKFFLSKQREDYYITHSRLVPYKRLDLLVEAFSQMPERRFLIVGKGPEEKRLKSLAKSNVEFLGYLQEEELSSFLSKARAYVFAAEEDFGISVVEAHASGLPVIALKKGGVLEIVLDGVTGVFFEEADVFSIIKAVRAFEEKEDLFDSEVIRKRAETFSLQRFQKEISQFVLQEKRSFYESCHFSGRERD